MFLRFMSLICLVLLISLFTSCPNGGNETDTQVDSGIGNVTNTDTTPANDATTDTATADAGTDATTTPEGGEVTTTEGTEGTTSGETETAPPAWSIEGVKQGEPIKLTADVENTITFKFELPKECHWNENTPLGMAVTFAPEGITVDPLEVGFEKPADVPSELVFKVKGVKADAGGDLAFDVRAFFCSDEGFCLRKNDTVSLSFVTGDSKEPAKYTVNYKLSIE